MKIKNIRYVLSHPNPVGAICFHIFDWVILRNMFYMFVFNDVFWTEINKMFLLWNDKTLFLHSIILCASNFDFFFWQIFFSFFFFFSLFFLYIQIPYIYDWQRLPWKYTYHTPRHGYHSQSLEHGLVPWHCLSIRWHWYW